MWYFKYVMIFVLFDQTLTVTLIDKNYDALWSVYKLKYKKKYALSEEDVRRVIWEKNVRHVSQHNLEADFGLHKYRLKVNFFSDKTVDELNVYRKCFNGKGQRASNHSSQFHENPCSQNCHLPPFVDWRIKGFVTRVKDQGDCGSCWAFSSTGALEAQNKAKNGVLISLSEQNLVDCSWKQGNSGCDGGWMENAFQYVIDNRGIDTEKDYPYIGMSSDCKFKRSDIGANCTKYIKIRRSSEKDLQSAIANIGPVSVAIDASSYNFMFYKEGIYVDHICSKEDLNHAVLVVGYGAENGTDYWIVKNSNNKGNTCLWDREYLLLLLEQYTEITEILN
ncbi:cathepsin L1-like isoform X2 [Stegodyphus dumicola]|uniref:cathepsin L1-like isoform X2 n=1 Tax=Stegodyphus dumicola TaxID=202533 RepID=UPI0015B3640C|nr:cathepsin L1-like isoform X2 [Stegodyphus dumicola]